MFATLLRFFPECRSSQLTEDGTMWMQGIPQSWTRKIPMIPRPTPRRRGLDTECVVYVAIFSFVCSHIWRYTISRLRRCSVVTPQIFLSRFALSCRVDGMRFVFRSRDKVLGFGSGFTSFRVVFCHRILARNYRRSKSSFTCF